MTEHPPPQNHVEASLAEIVSTDPVYDSAMSGPGRWCVLVAPLGQPVGTLWTDDKNGLGFVPVRIDQNERAPFLAADIRAAFLMAARYGTPASVVFDAWAARDGQALAARSVESGDLADLAQRVL